MFYLEDIGFMSEASQYFQHFKNSSYMWSKLLWNVTFLVDQAWNFWKIDLFVSVALVKCIFSLSIPFHTGIQCWSLVSSHVTPFKSNRLLNVYNMSLRALTYPFSLKCTWFNAENVKSQCSLFALKTYRNKNVVHAKKL